MKGFEGVLGGDHPRTLTRVSMLALVMQIHGKIDEAEKMPSKMEPHYVGELLSRRVGRTIYGCVSKPCPQMASFVVNATPKPWRQMPCTVFERWLETVLKIAARPYTLSQR